jgi:phosphohistidine phosphatase
MRIVLFRHGPAGRRDVSRWPDDASRPLTPRGEERTFAAAKGLRRLLGEGPVRIATSPLTRCAETAALLAEALGDARVVSLPALAPGGSAHELLNFVTRGKADETVVLVGHEPDLGKFAGTLLFGAPAGLPLKKAGACLIHFVGEVAPGEGQLRWFMPPRALRRLAGKKACV